MTKRNYSHVRLAGKITTISVDGKHLKKLHFLAKYDDRSMIKYLHRLIDKEYENLKESS